MNESSAAEDISILGEGTGSCDSNMFVVGEDGAPGFSFMGSFASRCFTSLVRLLRDFSNVSSLAAMSGLLLD